MNRTKANLLLLLAGAVWGMGFVAQSTAMEAIGPMLFVSLRFVLATLAVLPFALRETRKAEKSLTRSDWTGFVWIGIVLFAGMAFQQVGLLTTTVTNAGFLTGLYVVFVPLLVVIILRQRPHPVIWPAALLAFAGIWLLSGGGMTALNQGDMLVIVCAVFWAAQVILIGIYGTRTGRPLTMSAVQFAVCAVLGFLAAVAFEPVNWQAVMDAAPEIVYAGVFSSGLAFSLQAIGQRYTTSAQAAIFLSSESLFAALFGALLLGERIAGFGYLGCLFIFAAILAVEIIPATTSRRRGKERTT
ncbi:DMT family transporter [Hoeflea poritis]|uniref:DMT family transporter n=1 Tax=Hoeflea poritis TaxID=2993659 RepID=A0ABT4VRI8_9HYPH|nr:DMT family transporter [Hoeflea poritis]MDA4847304.1 DMT family transporter [Hoeflea poritis]